MRNTAWTLIQSGQIVSFRYKSSGRSVQRTVLCLDPEYIYRKKSTGRNVKFFIGLELYASDKPRLPRATLEQMFKILGKGDVTPSQTDAQEMQKIAPELVNDGSEYLGVAYGNLSGYLIEAIKELKAEIEELKKYKCDCKR